MKYETLWNISKEINGVKVYRIRALKDFSNVKAGDLGGYVEYPHNLSQNGDCWIYDDACVYGRAEVYDNVKVYGNAKVYGRAEVYGNAKVYGRAKVYGNAEVFGEPKICDNAEVYSRAEVYGEAKVYGDAKVCGRTIVCDRARVYDKAFAFGRAEVYGEAKVYGDAEVCGKAELFGKAEMNGGKIRKIRSKSNIITLEGQGRVVTAALNNAGKIEVEVGCFYGDLQEFESRIYKDGGYRSYEELPPHRQEYLEFVKELKTKEKVS